MVSDNLAGGIIQLDKRVNIAIIVSPRVAENGKRFPKLLS
jgi:hypothetical protein